LRKKKIFPSKRKPTILKGGEKISVLGRHEGVPSGGKKARATPRKGDPAQRPTSS